MICQNCNENTATIHLTEIINGKRHEKHLCEQCAQTENLSYNTQIPLNELLSNLLAIQPQELCDNSGHNEDFCPNCDIDMKEINEQSLLGCPEDYTFFNDAIEKLVDKTQDGNCVHTGKIPNGTQADTAKLSELERLKIDLEEAVLFERFEHAAELRDKIKLLECK